MAKTTSSSFVLLLLALVILTRICVADEIGVCIPPPCQGKQSWPELIGKDNNTVYTSVTRDNPQVTEIVLLISIDEAQQKSFSAIMKDMGPGGDKPVCCNRVILVLDAVKSGSLVVSELPQVG